MEENTEKSVKENTEISLEKHRKIEKTLSYLVCPKAKIMFQGCYVCYAFSRKQYELLLIHMEVTDTIVKDTLIDIRKDLNRSVSLCSKDDRVGDKIKDAFGGSTIVVNADKRMSQNLLTLFDGLPYRMFGNCQKYTCMPAETYRPFVLGCIGYYGGGMWRKNLQKS
jgi:hypothetical protein